MTLLIHENMSRGRSRKGWLDSFHTFSFGEFRDPKRMGFRALRVINEDWIIPGAGFAWHDHADMDILTLVLKGKVRHEDSLGHKGETAAGEIQLMRAGSGISHSEMNGAADETTHLLQIWIIPDKAGGTPGYQQASLPTDGPGVLLAGPAGSNALTQLGSDTRVTLLRTEEGGTTPVSPQPGRGVFLQIIEGLAEIDGERLTAGDGLQIDQTAPDIRWLTDGQALHFDLA